MNNNKLHIYVCNNFIADYSKALSLEDVACVEVIPYPCLCLKAGNRELAKQVIEADPFDKTIICGCHSDMLLSTGMKTDRCTFKTSNYCFNHLTSEPLLEYILEKGGYILTTGWLKSWRERIDYQGFNQEIARRFYSEFCKELILLDTGVDENIEQDLKDFSEYLDLPYRIVGIGLDHLKLFLKNCILEWQRSTENVGYREVLSEKNKKISDYAAIVKIIEQIACFTQKRDIFEQVKQLFVFIFGAKEVRFFDASEADHVYEEALLSGKSGVRQDYVVNETTCQMMIRLVWNDEIMGAIEAGGFNSVSDLKRYSAFAFSISRVIALAMSNALQYELLEKSRDEVVYNNNHDVLTGLYNRTFFTSYAASNQAQVHSAIFVCDIDGLKYVNDTFGHVIGDELIQAAGSALKKSFRDTDVVCRVGGDEFYIIMFDCVEESAEHAKDRIQQQINHYHTSHAELMYKLSLSVGYVYIAQPSEVIDWDAIISEADKRMYEEKNQKKFKLKKPL